MSYIQYNLGFSDGQMQKLSRAYKNKCPINIKLSHSQLTGSTPINLTQTQINSIKKAKSKGVGLVINLSKSQLQHQSGGFLGALAPLLTKTVIPLATKTIPKVIAPLATGALSGLASTGIGKIFGNGIVQIRNKDEFIRNARPYLTQAQINQLNRTNTFKLNKSQIEDIEKNQTGGFLPVLLASLAAHLAGEVIKGIVGKGQNAKGIQIGPPKRRVARGLQTGPPSIRRPLKKLFFENKPISNSDILKWVDKLNINNNFDGVFNRQELRIKTHINSSIIINLDDINGPGTDWCCMVKNRDTQYIYFDPFGMSPPLEVLNNFRFVKYNTIQYQERTSVLCGYFCLSFIKKYFEGYNENDNENDNNNNVVYDILYKELNPFNTSKNEQLIINYFKNI